MLHKIVEQKKQEVARLKQTSSIQALLRQAEAMEPPRGFRRALLDSQRPVSVIAEVKKASPSKGLIRPAFDPLAIAREYEQAGVEAISVLTDHPFFQGELSSLTAIHQAVGRPLLRKDFLLDEIQVVEARAAGADCILLIAAILEPQRLAALAQAAKELGMDVLAEVHDEWELEQVMSHSTPDLLGINNRDLRSFQVDLETTARLLPSVPPGLPVVSESGISTPEDLAFLQRAGVRAVLIGEHFMRQEQIARAVTELFGVRAPA